MVIEKGKKKKIYTGLKRSTRIIRNLTLIIPAAILILMIIVALFADLGWIGLPDIGLAPQDPNATHPRDKLLPPSFMEGGKSDYFLGTDRLGRDLFSRVIYGARVSLSVSLIVIFITALIGTILGILSGYKGGRADAFIMRVTDVALSFPGLLLAMLLWVAIGPGYWTVVLALSVLGWAGYARMIRGESLRIRESDFVAQAQVVGATTWRVMFKHIFPNIVNSLIVIMTLQIGMMILAEAALSFLGLGITAPTASWGSIVADGRTELDRAWWISAFPGICIGLVVMAGNFLGDWIRDKLDPRLRQL
ncbi:MAG: ABC transporter permease [Dehalococcoidales bacterium]|nr:ABC transporter permease [Dehalococcoidales bacterium]